MIDLLRQSDPLLLAVVFVAAYLIGSVPNAWVITKVLTGEDLTEHGTGNVGAMNVRRTTGSWGWFTVTMVADGLKGLLPTLLFSSGLAATMWPTMSTPSRVAAMAAVLGSVTGHNYSVWLALIKRRFSPSGKGLATGGGALLAYDWRYFLLVLCVGLAVIAVTRVLLAGQVAAAVALPVYAIVSRAPDWPFALLLGAAVYLRHHKRFLGLVMGKEPRLYIEDGQGPRG
ncbi:MAG: glycerol-3-phosphate 1-O-acyltransferase PlsY [Coriobacteriia bacterium]